MTAARRVPSGAVLAGVKIPGDASNCVLVPWRDGERRALARVDERGLVDEDPDKLGG